MPTRYRDDRYEYGEIPSPTPETPIQRLQGFEREQTASAALTADSFTRAVKQEQSQRMDKTMQENQARDRQRYGDHYRKVEIARAPSGSDGWGLLQQQAQARDAAYEKRQQELATRMVQMKADPLAAHVVGCQMKAEKAQYQADLASDILAKEIIARGPDSRYAGDLRAERDKFQQKADQAASRFAAAQDLHGRRPAHQQRQEAYKSLEAHARATGRTQEADFVAKYREFKQAQFAHRVAVTTGDKATIDKAAAKLNETRNQGIAMKAGLKTSQISQLSRELRSQQNGERLLTKPVDPQRQQHNLQQPLKASPFKQIGQNLARQDERKAKDGDTKSWGQEVRERRETLAKSGFTDDRAIRKLASSRVNFDGAMQRIGRGEAKPSQIEAETRSATATKASQFDRIGTNIAARQDSQAEQRQGMTM